MFSSHWQGHVTKSYQNCGLPFIIQNCRNTKCLHQSRVATLVLDQLQIIKDESLGFAAWRIEPGPRRHRETCDLTNSSNYYRSSQSSLIQRMFKRFYKNPRIRFFLSSQADYFVCRIDTVLLNKITTRQRCNDTLRRQRYEAK